MLKIIIASKNPVKIQAVKNGFERMFPDQQFAYEGVSVESQVKDQPTSNQEALIGAKNRADNAHTLKPEADYWIGLEGGIEKINQDMESFAWIYILSKHQQGQARTSNFYLPKKIIELIEQGKELGEADDIVFGLQNSKQINGSVGILTHNVINRTAYYTEAIIMALIPFKNPELY